MALGTRGIEQNLCRVLLAAGTSSKVDIVHDPQTLGRCEMFVIPQKITLLRGFGLWTMG